MSVFRHDRLRELLLKTDPFPGRQVRLARALRVSPSAVCEWLKGRKRPGASLLVNLAARLGVTADELLPPDVSGADPTPPDAPECVPAPSRSTT